MPTPSSLIIVDETPAYSLDALSALLRSAPAEQLDHCQIAAMAIAENRFRDAATMLRAAGEQAGGRFAAEATDFANRLDQAALAQ